MGHKELDPVSGLETTGHEWDGLKELNTPLPTWWIYTLWVTVVWAVGYWIVYPAWPMPGGFTKGVMGYSSRAELEDRMAAVDAAKAPWRERFAGMAVTEIARTPDLLDYAFAGGRVLFAENCAACHGAGGGGAPGYPALADDAWLWGGTLEAIEQTVRFGIRSGHDEARISDMPRFGADQILTAAEIGAIADYVLALAPGAAPMGAGKEQQLYADNCAACHGDAGKGNAELGAPDLTDAIWQYGAARDAIVRQISAPKQGVMPAWTGRLSDVEIKQLSIYVHALGGGQ